jgi:putative spermidine/putrescine transport system ATP-binding protein
LAENGAKLSLRGVSKVYNKLVALHPTDLEIEPGEFFSLIGPSGSGKTTLLGAVAGFMPPSQGRIEVDGRDIVTLPPYRRDIGMVFQNYALFPHMTVAENIAFPLRLRKMPDADVRERVRRMLATVRLPDVGDRMPSQLSGGQQQRIALARAAVYDPRLLLMDEPLGALDKNLREDMQYEIKAFHRAINATVLYVTHDQDEAATMSDRIAIMNRGRIVQHGTPRELYEHPRNTFIAAFLGSANLISVEGAPERHSEAVTVRIAGDRELKALDSMAGENGSAALCIRPEAIRIVEAGYQPGPEENRIEGRVIDAVYTAGTFRYQVESGTDEPISVRLPSIRHSDMLQPGASVTLAWPASATLLIPKE